MSSIFNISNHTHWLICLAWERQFSIIRERCISHLNEQVNDIIMILEMHSKQYFKPKG